jgi:DNA polymerase III, alpha subunit
MESQQVLNDDFIHLHVHSSYSLLEGAITTKKLKELCFQNNIAGNCDNRYWQYVCSARNL